MTTLVLWDIDGTLVDVKGAGRRAFIHGIERAWGVVDDLADVNFAGATDLGVLASLRLRLPLPEEHTPSFFLHMAEALERGLAAAAQQPRGTSAASAVAVAGAVEVVLALQRRGDIVQGLVTGNARATAFVKLRHASVPHEQFSVGAFGDEHADRCELANRAFQRARRAAPVDRVVLIGDTVNDVRAARSVGAVAVALLRRPHERGALVEAGADHILDQLTDLLRIVGDDSGSKRAAR